MGKQNGFKKKKNRFSGRFLYFFFIIPVGAGDSRALQRRLKIIWFKAKGFFF